MADKKTILAIIVVVVVIAAAAVILMQGNGSNQPAPDPDDKPTKEKYTFTDANSITHTVDVPIENVSVVHKYIPIFMKILGKEDSVAGLDSKYGARFAEYFPNHYFIGSYSAPEGETMVSRGSNVILTPVTMGLSNADALRQLGIEVIYLDLTDPYEIESNLLILAKLLGGTDDVMKKYDTYMSYFNECFDFVKDLKTDADSEDVFGLFMASSGFYQTHASSAVKVIESVAGRCYTNIIDPSTTDTVYFNQSKDILLDVDNKYGLDYMFIYSNDTPKENFDAFFSYAGTLDYSKLTCVKEGHLFALSTDTVNGAMSCISAILYADAFGADVGDKAVQMLNKMNSEFGLKYSTEDLLVAYSA